MMTKEHTVYVDCDHVTCSHSTTIGAPTYAACISELRRAGWQIGRTTHFCPLHGGKRRKVDAVRAAAAIVKAARAL